MAKNKNGNVGTRTTPKVTPRCYENNKETGKGANRGGEPKKMVH